MRNARRFWPFGLMLVLTPLMMGGCDSEADEILDIIGWSVDAVLSILYWVL